MQKRFCAIVSFGLIYVTVALTASDEGARFEVTIRNLTRGEVFTPILAASRKADVKLLTPGQPPGVTLDAR